MNEVKIIFITAGMLRLGLAKSLWRLDSTGRFCDRRASALSGSSKINPPMQSSGGGGSSW